VQVLSGGTAGELQGSIPRSRQSPHPSSTLDVILLPETNEGFEADSDMISVYLCLMSIYSTPGVIQSFHIHYLI
jgi:hypothetical protein